jgi:hypothetical protein
MPRTEIDSDEKIDNIVRRYIEAAAGVTPGGIKANLSARHTGVVYQAALEYVPQFLKKMSKDEIREFHRSGQDWRSVPERPTISQLGVEFIEEQAALHKRITRLETTISNVIDMGLVDPQGVKILKAVLKG